LEAENKSLHGTVTDLALRVAVLEEARNTVDARVRAVISETVFEMRAQMMQAQSAQPSRSEKKSLPPASAPKKRRQQKK
jgi:hypothetical protein